MHAQQTEKNWLPVCGLAEILPNTGVCALLEGRQIAVFHVSQGEARLFAIDNYDPNAAAAVLSRGLIGNLGERIVVASPLYKHHFDLQTGACLEAPQHSVQAYATRLEHGQVWVAL